jgi:SAM-dependent methyltransferase
VAAEDAALACTRCGARYPSRLGISILLRRDLFSAKEGSDPPTHKERQIGFFDQDSVDDFGVTRPRGAPELYGWLLGEKFRRSIIGLEDLLPGSTALTICGGSGLDAEYLARAGARVIASDISIGVLLQARERATRFGLEISFVVADAEALPFHDRSVDVVYVHDGLHHLERPALALAEMARVGWAEKQEEAGNLVRRLTLDEIVSELAARGFRPVAPHRYGMYYRHWPGRVVGALSQPVLLPLAKAGFGATNRIAGRYGNKLTVQAVRVAGEELAPVPSRRARTRRRPGGRRAPAARI